MLRKNLVAFFLCLVFCSAGPLFANYEFGMPGYDSGWRSIATNADVTLNFAAFASSVNHLVVDLQCRSSSSSYAVNQRYFGGHYSSSSVQYGAFWKNLEVNEITVHRDSNDTFAEEFRVRIWNVPQANYDSGWTNLGQSGTIVFTHNLGGDTDDYLVYLESKSTDYIFDFGINQLFYGMMEIASDHTVYGARWQGLSNSAIRVYRGDDDRHSGQVRVRIWKLRGSPDYDSGWTSIGQGVSTTFNHYLGGPWSDYVVDLQFQATGVWPYPHPGIHQIAYGGAMFDGDYNQGAYWRQLNGSGITVTRMAGDNYAAQVRVRIWACSEPKYDSGWRSTSSGSNYFTHNLGGNVDDYVVNMTFHNTSGDIMNQYYGGDRYYDGSVYHNVGGYWSHLSTSQLRFWEMPDDTSITQTRIRIWIPPKADYDSGWTTVAQGSNTTFNHNLGGTAQDYCVYLEAKDDGSLGTNQMYYGSSRQYNSSSGTVSYYGLNWRQLTGTSIVVRRYGDDTCAEQVRVRIWKKTPLTSISSRYTKVPLTSVSQGSWTNPAHNLAGDVDDFVVDLLHYDTDTYGYNQIYHGLRRFWSAGTSSNYDGVYYTDLKDSATTLDAWRGYQDGPADQIQTRFWDLRYSPETVFVYGRVTLSGSGLSGVTVSFSGSGGGTATTNSSGYYTMSLPYGYSGTATPGLSGYSFSAPSTTYSGVSSNIQTNYTASVGTAGQIALDRTHLYFGSTGSSNTTSPQWFRISNSGSGTMNWTATEATSWMSLSPGSGTNSGLVNVTVSNSGLSTGTYNGTITVSSPDASNSPRTVAVTLTVKSSGADANPFGSFDTPTNGSTVRSSVPVTGWVLDDVECSTLKIYRNPVSGEGSALIYIGDAVFVEGARPDVEAGYPTYPFAWRAGWGYMMLTNFLPNGGNGVFTIYARATDSAGHTVTLGTKTITCDNAHAVKPFGAIDTPTQGGTASGSSYINFGWALTPLPNYIPIDGSTLTVYVDGVSLGHPVYNQYRADIATLFPGYANSDGAVGYRLLNTTGYANGVHTIQWVATDSAANADGIGSRYFNIQNSGSAPAQAAAAEVVSAAELEYLPADRGFPVQARRGYGNQPLRDLDPDEAGRFVLEIREDERVELRPAGEGLSLLAGWLRAGETLRPLPVGSTLDGEAGAFYWQPGPGFIGDYELWFLVSDSSGGIYRKVLTIRIAPKFGGIEEFSPVKPEIR